MNIYKVKLTVTSVVQGATPEYAQMNMIDHIDEICTTEEPVCEIQEIKTKAELAEVWDDPTCIPWGCSNDTPAIQFISEEALIDNFMENLTPKRKEALLDFIRKTV